MKRPISDCPFCGGTIGHDERCAQCHRHDRHRGHRIEQLGPESWVYADTRQSVPESPERPCGLCGRANTADGHDGCLGTLPVVMNACCGHGRLREAYVQFEDGRRLDGVEAFAFFAQHDAVP